MADEAARKVIKIDNANNVDSDSGTNEMQEAMIIDFAELKRNVLGARGRVYFRPEQKPPGACGELFDFMVEDLEASNFDKVVADKLAEIKAKERKVHWPVKSYFNPVRLPTLPIDQFLLVRFTYPVRIKDFWILMEYLPTRTSSKEMKVVCCFEESKNRVRETVGNLLG